MAHNADIQHKQSIIYTRPGAAVHGPDSFRGVPLTPDALMRDERTRSLILQDEIVIAFIFGRPRLMRMTARHPGGRAFAETIDDGPPASFMLGAENVVPKCMAKFRDFVRG